MHANRSVLGAHQPISKQQNDTSTNVTALGKMQSVDWTFFFNSRGSSTYGMWSSIVALALYIRRSDIGLRTQCLLTRTNASSHNIPALLVLLLAAFFSWQQTGQIELLRITNNKNMKNAGHTLCQIVAKYCDCNIFDHITSPWPSRKNGNMYLKLLHEEK